MLCYSYDQSTVAHTKQHVQSKTCCMCRFETLNQSVSILFVSTVSVGVVVRFCNPHRQKMKQMVPVYIMKQSTPLPLRGLTQLSKTHVHTYTNNIKPFGFSLNTSNESQNYHNGEIKDIKLTNCNINIQHNKQHKSKQSLLFHQNRYHTVGSNFHSGRGIGCNNIQMMHNISKRFYANESKADYYDVLGVSKDSSDSDIKKAFYKV